MCVLSHSVEAQRDKYFSSQYTVRNTTDKNAIIYAEQCPTFEVIGSELECKTIYSRTKCNVKITTTFFHDRVYTNTQYTLFKLTRRIGTHRICS